MNLNHTAHKPLILCADDYGISPGVGRGIRALAAAGRLSATSCMTVFADWRDEAPQLEAVADRIDIGLHLTLTDQAPLGAMPRLAPGGRLPPLGRLIRLAHLRRIDRDEVRGEIARQLDAFEAALGRAPDFIDGHQHAHVLPVIRDAVLDLFGRRLDLRNTWLRSCVEPLPRVLHRRIDAPRALVIAGLAGPLHRRAAAAGIATNLGFAGVTSFRPDRSVAADFSGYLSVTGRRPLVMCHPGEPDEVLALRDPITAARAAELDYLGSDGFARLLEQRGIVLARGPRAGGG